MPLIRRAIAYAVVVLLVLVTLIVLEATGSTHIITEFHARFVNSIVAALAEVLTVITGLVGTVAIIVPSFKIAFASNKESNVSRGDQLFEEASTVRDQLGFLAKVKAHTRRTQLS